MHRRSTFAALRRRLGAAAMPDSDAGRARDAGPALFRVRRETSVPGNPAARGRQRARSSTDKFRVIAPNMPCITGSADRTAAADSVYRRSTNVRPWYLGLGELHVLTGRRLDQNSAIAKGSPADMLMRLDM